MRHMPMSDCPHCGVRQYAAASYVEQPRCVACDSPLRSERFASPLPVHRWPPPQLPQVLGTRNGKPR